MKDLSEQRIRAKEFPSGSNEICTSLSFQSITRRFLSSSKSSEIFCPSCGTRLNFHSGLEWVGPDSFTCTTCNQLLNISLIRRALRDLGVE